jgi:hypothetical protein
MGLAGGIFWAAVIIGSIILLYAGSFGLLDFLNGVMRDENVSGLVKLLLALPFVFMFLWCIVLQIISILFTLGLAISVANSFRNWWHSGVR